MQKKQGKPGNKNGRPRIQKKQGNKRRGKNGNLGNKPQGGKRQTKGKKKGKGRNQRFIRSADGRFSLTAAPTPRPGPAPTPAPTPAPHTPFPTVLPGLNYNTGPAPQVGSGPAAIEIFERLSFNNQNVADAGCKKGRVFNMQFSSELDLSPCQCTADVAGKLAVTVCTMSTEALHPAPLRFRVIDTCDGTATTFHAGFEGQLHLLANLVNPYYDDKRFANEFFGGKCTYIHDFPLELKFTGGIKLSSGNICKC
mmetsp:Transcript_122873/g.352881  ORF Transcript_122873/g.352881 Transcript_122873/m.352881 type:complete len:253 (+) Transcript_122873:256-1014(+)